MTAFLVRIFIPDYEQVGDGTVRQKYGILGGAVGICCNLILFACKLLIGILTGAISITADAFNNLSDAGSSVVTLLGFKMAGKPADMDHPFGHGRIEYLSGFFVAVAIMLVGVELAKSSFDKLLHPSPVSYNILSICILIGSILMKLWMSQFNRTLGKKINSAAMKATAADSLSDCIATGAVVLCIAINYITGLYVDAIAGMAVALFILYAGINAAKDTLQPLLGQAPDPELVAGIEELVMSHEEIVGIHDLIIHDYGPGRVMASLHAEIPYDMDILRAHDVIDDIESDLRKEFRCDVTIHMDPIVTDDARTNQMRDKVTDIVKRVDSDMTIHDFRMTQGPGHMNLIFDVVVPFSCKLPIDDIKIQIRRQVKELDGTCYAVVGIDRGYVNPR